MKCRGCLLVALLTWGCSGDGLGTSHCVDQTRHEIYGGSEAPGLLAIPEGQILAIGGLEGARGDVVCSATLVAPGRLLTARHCSSAFRFRTGREGDERRFQVEARFDHPARDLAVLAVDAAALAELGVLPIRVWQDHVDASWVGRELTLSGLGTDEAGQTGQRLFSVEPVARVEADRIEMDGQAERGACGGDSGGPLLGRDEAGAVRVIGALSTGDASCLGRDRYERVDTQAEWLGKLLVGDADGCD